MCLIFVSILNARSRKTSDIVIRVAVTDCMNTEIGGDGCSAVNAVTGEMLLR